MYMSLLANFDICLIQLAKKVRWETATVVSFHGPQEVPLPVR